MRRLDRYIFMECLSPFVLGLLAFNAILFASGPLRRSLVLMVEWDVAPLEALRYLLYNIPAMVGMTFSMSVLLAVLLGIGRLSSENEAIAMFTSGLSFYRFMAPILVLGLGVSALSYVFNESLVPKSNAAAEALAKRMAVAYAESGKRMLVLQDPKTGPPNRIIVAVRYDDEKRLLVRPDVVEYQKGRPALVVSAERAYWDGLNWVFENGALYTLGVNGRLGVMRFPKLSREIGKSPAEIEDEQRPVDMQTMTANQLRNFIARVRNRARPHPSLLMAEVELHNRYALPLVSLLFCLVAAPLAVRPRRTSRGVAFALSVGIIFVYYVVWFNMSWLGHNGRVPPAVASWTANVLMAAVGSALVVRAARGR